MVKHEHGNDKHKNEIDFYKETIFNTLTLQHDCSL
jgi:hypothetical protein